MYKEKFTKGPWYIDKYFALKGANAETITLGRLSISIAHYDDVECEANNHLVQCAPDMYELLQSLADHPSEINVITIEKLLAKARGE